LITKQVQPEHIKAIPFIRDGFFIFRISGNHLSFIVIKVLRMAQLRTLGASKRMEALTDGIFAIVATILVLEIKVPKLPENYSNEEMAHAMREIMPYLFAFIFSFLNVLIFWFNHDTISRTLFYFDRKLTFLNFFFLLFISLIPFTTAFVSEYPMSREAVAAYGLVLFLASLVAALMYHHIAFRSDMMHPSVSLVTRRRIWRKVIVGPMAFLIAIMLGLLHPVIPIFVYIIMPLFFMFMPAIDMMEDLEKKNAE